MSNGTITRRSSTRSLKSSKDKRSSAESKKPIKKSVKFSENDTMVHITAATTKHGSTVKVPNLVDSAEGHPGYSALAAKLGHCVLRNIRQDERVIDQMTLKPSTRKVAVAHIYWPNGQIYKGPLNKEKMPHGTGLVTFADGTAAKAKWHNGSCLQLLGRVPPQTAASLQHYIGGNEAQHGASSAKEPTLQSSKKLGGFLSLFSKSKSSNK